MHELGEHAVVCGAGMAGLLAARVLAEFYPAVTLVERDRLPVDAAQRQGIPHGRHFHALSIGGTRIFERLFPGLLDDLVADGAMACADGNLSRICFRAGGHELNRSGQFADPAALVLFAVSRPLLESQVRQRVRNIANVAVLDGHDVVEPVAGQPNRITGVRVVDRDSGVEAVLDADLVLDAMGRSARTPAFLERIGYGRPAERRAVMHGSYSSQLLAIPDGLLTERLIFVCPESTRPTGGALSAYENGAWMMTVACVDGRPPPRDLAAMISSFEQFAPPAAVAAVRACQPIGEVSIIQHGGVWRRYDKLSTFPDGLLVFGDAMCSFNPIYGQGMTVAALEAIALRDCLSGGDGDLSRRFFRAAAQRIRPVWARNQVNDLYMTKPIGRRSIPQRLATWRIDKTLSAAENDPELTERIFRVIQFIDPPSALIAPTSVRRLLTNRARRKRAPRTSLMQDRVTNNG
jgi:2-polyprenyl-6-methoxyphenol hydroxylase-like FAD-dependent oxidoreductase